MFNNVPKDVLALMSPAEVAEMISQLRAEAGLLEHWNDQRGNWQPPAPRWRTDAPPPMSANDYGKVRVR